ncbi:hypothetical protein F5Y19DRAFT_452021 [Xylariaceae sp. FL1651]|nr:hypothetical protein F5Y19DRAFT_452021 [Xylariaceae sp. FL1651]
MKLFLIAMGAATLVSAQADSTGYFPGEPSCALPCLSSAINAAGCQLSDIGCQCGPTQTVIAGKVATCLIAKCNPTELGVAQSAGEAVCSSYSAGELTFTNPGGPLSTVVSGSSGGTSETSVIMTAPPTPSSTVSSTSESGSGFGSGSMSMTSNSTATKTVGGLSSTHTLPSLTQSLSGSSPASTAAAATPAKIGAGILAGIMGAVAFL